MNCAEDFARFATAIVLLAGGLFAQESRARIEFDSASAEVGQPLHATVTVDHAASARPKLDSLGLDDSWLVLDSKPGPTTADPALADRARTTWMFEIASLEPGDRAIAELPLSIDGAKIAVQSAVLAVHGVLAEGEDAPRPSRGLREIETVDRRAKLWWWIGGAVALTAVLAGAVALFLRRRARSEVAGAPAPSVRLAILETRPLDTPQDVQAAHFALTRLLRESADLRAGRDRSGLTDEEWRSAARTQFDAAGLSAAEQSALEQLLERAAVVKYGAERPTQRGIIPIVVMSEYASSTSAGSNASTSTERREREA